MQNSKQENIVIAILLVIIILLVGGGIYVYTHNAAHNSVSPGSTAASTLHPGTYDNFGISFQYPPAWGIPQEEFHDSNGVQLVSISLSTSTEPGSAPLLVYTTQDTGPTGQIKNETFDQMMARYMANNSTFSIKDITVNGITGRELYDHNVPNGQPYPVSAYFDVGHGLYVVFENGGETTDFENAISTFAYNSANVPEENNDTGAAVYSNNGIHFDYNLYETITDYSQLSIGTSVEKEDMTKLDAKGCYPGSIDDSGKPPSTTIVTIPNGTSFCLDTAIYHGAGQLDTTYEYTTFHNGNAYRISYSIQTVNSCDIYGSAADQEGCTAFKNNYTDLVLKPIQQSIATFGFGN